MKYDFKSSLSLLTMLGDGWSIPEPENNLVWNDGFYSDVRIPISESDENIKLSFSLKPHLSGLKKYQRIEIYIWGLLLGSFVLVNPIVTNCVIIVPSYVSKFKFLNVKIKWVDAEIPKVEGSLDKRILGAALYSIECNK